jgi:hypothetical protein
MSLRLKLLVCVITVLHGAGVANAQTGLGAPTLQHLAERSGLIFAGSVLAVTYSNGIPPYGIATQEITMRVSSAFRGVQTGQTVQFRELLGANGLRQRYRVGERLLLFLYPRSKLGLTTPVEGAFGRFEIDGDGKVLLEQARVNTLSADPVLRTPLRSVPPRRNAVVAGRLFRRAVVHSMGELQ